jgi:hypothetical protein
MTQFLFGEVLLRFEATFPYREGLTQVVPI